MVRGDCRAVGHASLPGRHIDISAVLAVFAGRDQHHVQPFLQFGEKNVFRVDPGQALGIAQHDSRFASQHWHDPGVPETGHRCIRDARAVRRKLRTHLFHAVVCQLDGFAVGQKLDINLALSIESVGAANKRQHSPVRRDRRRNG